MFKIGKSEEELIETALKALDNAYVLWGLRVGVAVLVANGRICEGSRVESWVSGVRICAERCS